MKKVLSFVLVLAMILGSFSMVFAVAEDVEGTKYESAVTALVDLGVINGYPDGTFRPANNITRAEFCKVVIKALGLDYDGSTAPTVFTDVPSSHWASGYVQAAYELGIVNGRSATIFDPEANVSYNEAIAMIVRALGYEDDHLVGTYPTAHIAKAKGIGILGSVSVGSAAAPRGDVAQLVYNALDTPFVAYTGTSGEEKAQSDSMLKRLTGSTKSTTQAAVFTDTGATGLEGYDKASGANLKAYLGANATYFLDKDDNIIAIKEVKSTFLTGKFNAAGTKFTADDDTEYDVVGGSATATAAAFNNGVFSGASVTFAGEEGVKIAAKVSGKKINQVYSFQVWDVNDAFQFDDDLDMDDKTLHGVSFAQNDDKKIDYASFELLGVDDIKDIKKDNVVYIYQGNGTGDITKIEVGTKTVDGKVTKISSSNKYTIGGTAYKVSGEAGAVTPNINDEGTFYLDYAGKIYEFEGAAGDKMYGVALAWQDHDVFTKDAKVKIYTAEGKKVIYDASSKVLDSNDNWDYATAAAVDKVVEYTLDKDGKIRSITDAGLSAASSTTIKKTGVISGSSVRYNASSLIFNQKAAGKYSVVKAADIYDTSSLTLNDVKVKNGVVTVAMVSGVAQASDDIVVLTGWAEVSSDDYDYEVYALVNGKEVTYGANTAVMTEASNAALGDMYTLTFDGAEATAFNKVTADQSFTTTKASLSSGVLKDNVTDATYTMADSVVVYIYKSADNKSADKEWSIGTASNLSFKSNSGYTVYLFNTKEGEYDTAILVK
jgi:hypothetical protein